MSNIEEMRKLQAKSQVYNIPADPKDGVQARLEIHPLGLDDMGLLDAKKDMTMEEMTKGTKSLIAASLKINESDVIMDIKFLEELMKAIMDLNGFDTTDMKDSGIKKFIEEKKKVANEAAK